jgi:hypothetical protein
MDLLDHIKKLMNNADIADHDKQESGNYVTDGNIYKTVATEYLTHLIKEAQNDKVKQFLTLMQQATADIKKDQLSSPAKAGCCMQWYFNDQLKQELKTSEAGKKLLAWKDIAPLTEELGRLERLPLPDLSSFKQKSHTK